MRNLAPQVAMSCYPRASWGNSIPASRTPYLCGWVRFGAVRRTGRVAEDYVDLYLAIQWQGGLVSDISTCETDLAAWGREDFCACAITCQVRVRRKCPAMSRKHCEAARCRRIPSGTRSLRWGGLHARARPDSGFVNLHSATRRH